MKDADDEKIERFIADALSGLPLRPAPDALQQRVLAEVARRGELPWWRRNFAKWPMTARTGFVAVCVLLAGLSLAEQFSTQTWSWTQSFIGLTASFGGMMNLAVSLVPPGVLYVAVGVGASLYTVLFALSAFAYRTLYLQPSGIATSRT